MKTEHIERLWEYCTPHWKYLLLIPQNSHLGVKHFSFRDLSGQWTHHTGGGKPNLTMNQFEDGLHSVWGQLGWDALIYNPCFGRRGMLAPPAPDCPPTTTTTDFTRCSQLWKEGPPHAKRLRLCEEVCCSFVAVILNLSSCLWITLTNYEFSLMFFWGVGGVGYFIQLKVVGVKWFRPSRISQQ